MPRRAPLLVCHTAAVRGWQTAGWLLALWTSTWSVSAQQPGDTGLICSFGAGYSAGTVFVRKRA